MCDVGRANYRWMNRGDRAEAPLVREGSRLIPTDWDSALERLAALAAGAGRVVLLASGRASIESLGWLRRLFEGGEVTAAIKVPLGGEAALPGIPDLALRKERSPNLEGARLAGFTSGWNEALDRISGAGLVVVLDVELEESEIDRLAAASSVVAITTLDDDRLKGAALVLPTTSMAEEHGTYVNRARRAQRYNQAKAGPGMSRPAWWIAGEAWALSGSGRASPGTTAEAFARLGETIAAVRGVTHAELGLTGRVLDAPSATPAGTPR